MGMELWVQGKEFDLVMLQAFFDEGFWKWYFLTVNSDHGPWKVLKARTWLREC